MLFHHLAFYHSGKGIARGASFIIKHNERSHCASLFLYDTMQLLITCILIIYILPLLAQDTVIPSNWVVCNDSSQRAYYIYLMDFKNTSCSVSREERLQLAQGLFTTVTDMFTKENGTIGSESYRIAYNTVEIDTLIGLGSGQNANLVSSFAIYDSITASRSYYNQTSAFLSKAFTVLVPTM